jgi:MEMO1 family protein
MRIRSAAVEGRFYPSTKSRIFDQIMEIEQSGRYPEPDISPKKVFGAVLPHAGHIYSGYQTIPFFQLIRRHGIFPDTFVIIHPNHSGHGLPISIDDSALWVNAIGEVPVDLELARTMEIPFDKRAHLREHSAEVIIPFIQYFLEDHPFSIVPVSMTEQTHKNAVHIADRVIRGIAKTGRKIMIIASCDFSHFLSPKQGHAMDQLILNNIMSRNAPEVEKTVKTNQLSVCGFGPVMTLMEYAHSRSDNYQIEVLARGHSGEVSASPEVVDYISIIFYK